MAHRTFLEAAPPHVFSASFREALLAHPLTRGKKPRVVIDTDAANEIDDQFALAWALLSRDEFLLEGVYAAPYSYECYRVPQLRAAYNAIRAGRVDEARAQSDAVLFARAHTLARIGIDPAAFPDPGPAEGMENSFQEALRVFQKLNINPSGLLFRGAARFMQHELDPVPSEAAAHLIARAEAGSRDDPLYVLAVGCPTTVSAAIAAAPHIIDKIVVVWTAAYPTSSNLANFSYNLNQDLFASQLLFSSGVPLVYLPGYHVGAELKISMPDVEAWVRGCGEIGDYLYELFANNPLRPLLGIDPRDHFGRTWILWDLIAVAWLLNPAWVPTHVTPAPLLGDDHYWYRNAAGHLIREAHGIDRDAIFRDLLTKLAAQKTAPSKK